MLYEEQVLDSFGNHLDATVGLFLMIPTSWNLEEKMWNNCETVKISTPEVARQRALPPSRHLTRAEEDPSFWVEVHGVDGVLPCLNSFRPGANPPRWHPKGHCNPSQLKWAYNIPQQCDHHDSIVIMIRRTKVNKWTSQLVDDPNDPNWTWIPLPCVHPSTKRAVWLESRDPGLPLPRLRAYTHTDRNLQFLPSRL